MSKSTRNLAQGTWRNWILLLTISCISTVGLAIAVFPLLRNRMESPWPWVNTDLVLIICFSVAVLAFLAYLTWQQLHVRDLFETVQALQEDRETRGQQHYKRLMALLRVSRIMGEKTDAKEIFDAITQTCYTVFECSRVSLMLLDTERDELEVQSVKGDSDTSMLLGERVQLGQGIAGWVAERGEPRIVGREEFEEISGGNLKRSNMRQAMIVPIKVRDELVGVVNVSSETPEHDYDDEDLKALQVFGENAGACIRHAQQARWLRKTIDQLQKEIASRAETSVRRVGE